MEPVGVDYRQAKGFLILHRCLDCGFMRPNRAAPDDTEALIALMGRR
jgi:hypothetical protein